MRAHANGFAELMLDYATNDQSPGKAACWPTFSGLLDDDAINSADWAGNKNKMSVSSHAVDDIAMFTSLAGSAAMYSPAPHVAYQLTTAKAKAPELPIEYEPLGPRQADLRRVQGQGRGVRQAQARRDGWQRRRGRG